MTVLSTGGAIASTAPGRVWDRFNVIASCGRIGSRTLKIQKRSVSLPIFAVGLILSLIFFALWVATDQVSTWQWTEFLGGQAGTTLEDMAVTSLGTVSFAVAFLRLAIWCLSAVPTLMEVLAPYFADQDDILAAAFIAFSAFDFYTDWPKAAEVAAMGDFSGWGQLAGLGQWIWTVALAFFFSLIVQYIFFLLAWMTACAAWNLIFGPAKG